jgi:hypothetical protein
MSSKAKASSPSASERNNAADVQNPKVNPDPSDNQSRIRRSG